MTREYRCDWNHWEQEKCNRIGTKQIVVGFKPKENIYYLCEHHAPIVLSRAKTFETALRIRS